MSNVEIVIATVADKVALQNMMQLYIHDFTEQWIGLTDLELGRNAIGTHPVVNGLEECDVTNDAWDGAILRFQIRPQHVVNTVDTEHADIAREGSCMVDHTG